MKALAAPLAMGSVRQLEAFLLAAVAAAGRGTALPAGWRPIDAAAPTGLTLAQEGA